MQVLFGKQKKPLNVGFDASFLNQRLTVGAEYYNSKPVTYWLRLRLPFLPVIKEGSPWKNAASLRNKGFEFTFGWEDQISRL